MIMTDLVHDMMLDYSASALRQIANQASVQADCLNKYGTDDECLFRSRLVALATACNTILSLQNVNVGDKI